MDPVPRITSAPAFAVSSASFLCSDSIEEESAEPKFIVHSGEQSLDLWNGFGIGSPEVEELISFTELLLKKNPKAKLNINFDLSAKNLSVLKKYKSGEEKIRLLYNYILQKQKSTNVQGEIYGM